MYYNQTILNSDRYSLYITIIKSDNNMTTEALKHYKGRRVRGGERVAWMMNCMNRRTKEEQVR